MDMDKEVLMLKEYLDKDYGKPLYDYLKNGERWSSEGRFHLSKKMIPFFFKYALRKMTDDSFKEFCKLINTTPKLKEHFIVYSNGTNRVIKAKSKMSDGYKEVKLSDFVKQNASSLFRIMYIENGQYDNMWLEFYNYMNSDKGMADMSMDKNVDSDVTLMNPQMLKTQWLIHFTYKKNDAVSICKNGFKFGVEADKMSQLNYTNRNEKLSNEKGKFGYAYNALTVGDNSFKSKSNVPREDWEFQDNFTQKAWERAMHFAVMFKASGVQAFHGTDRETQVIFNRDMAQDFVLLAFNWDTNEVVHPKDIRAHKGNLKGNAQWNVLDRSGKSIYKNDNLSKVVKWVIDNFDQYRKNICWSHNNITEEKRVLKEMNDRHKVDDYMEDYDMTYVLDQYYEHLLYGTPEVEDWGVRINPSMYQKALNDFVQHGEFTTFPTKYVYQWMGICMKNACILHANTELCGHTPYDPTEMFIYSLGGYFHGLRPDLFNEYGEAEDYDKAKEFVDDWLENQCDFYDWVQSPNGHSGITDYGLKPIFDIILQYREDMKAEEVLVLVNKILDCYHWQGELSDCFIEGGDKALSQISNREYLSEMKKIHISERQEQMLINENIKIHKGEKGKSCST